ncbi:MAG: calcium-binding protein [Pleurocapsa sp. MO_226.B13]|nr:calcium-binding protein [Pleurocapsa sp. MO_226.B13]
MSHIVSPDNTESLLETPTADGGLHVVAQQDEENIIEIKGDAEVGIVGGKLADTITTGAGDAAVFTGDGEDVITGGTGDDIFRGGEGDDVIRGGLGADIIIGGAGNDILRGGRGGVDADGNPMGDILKGGSGDDIFEFAASEFEDGSMDEIVDFKADGFADTIKIFGVGSTEEGAVTYDADTGMVSINGQEAIDIGMNQDVEFKTNEDNDTWELF